ncbi:MAG: phosphoethanolamine transferase domain-containing protein, partial [Burkholderiaceae bacterium]
MRLPRPATLLLIASYLGLSALPFWPLGRDASQAAAVLAVTTLAWLALWALGGRPARFHWLLLPAFLLAPIELYLRHFYGTGITAHHLGILAETTPAEVLEFLGGRGWLALLVLLATLGWWALCWRAARRTRALDCS